VAESSIPCGWFVIFNQLGRGVAPVFNNPAVWGGADSYQNLVPGQPLFLVDPNCHCFDPTKQLMLNPAAWTDAGPGQFGTAAPYYEGYRWQRQPLESMSFGRVFPLSKEGRVNLQVRLEFQNILNRVAYGLPTTTNPQALTFRTNPFPNNQPGALSSGFGFCQHPRGRSLWQSGKPADGSVYRANPVLSITCSYQAAAGALPKSSGGDWF
jgi:hypothetical protein